MTHIAASTRLAVAACAGLAALVAATAVAGCGPAASTQSSSVARPTASALEQAQAPVLAISAITGLPAQTRALTAGLLAEDSTIKSLRNTITGLGFVGGRERIFQGNSKRLTFVDSRALVFDTPAGAAHYLDFVHAHANDFFGLYPSMSPLVSGSAAGWVFEPQPCACHMANPAFVGIARRGSLLLWLEINGPAATDAELRTLLLEVR